MTFLSYDVRVCVYKLNELKIIEVINCVKSLNMSRNVYIITSNTSNVIIVILMMIFNHITFLIR